MKELVFPFLLSVFLTPFCLVKLRPASWPPDLSGLLGALLNSRYSSASHTHQHKKQAMNAEGNKVCAAANQLLISRSIYTSTRDMARYLTEYIIHFAVCMRRE